jgi:UDP-N-acetylmuramate--alanine ligase
MNLEKVKYVYFLGAGGIGMSALGRYFLQRGIAVGGYDKTPTSLTVELENEGMYITFDDSLDTLPEILKTPSVDPNVLVVYTPAIPKDHKQFNYLKEYGVTLYKRAQILGIISSNHTTLAVAGTHGKTTTSTLIAHILQVAGMQPVAFLGGIAVNYSSNYLPGNSSSLLVVEADEYDRSFLQLSPHSAVITSTDADHLDIYGKREDLIESFNLFAEKTNADGYLITKVGIDLDAKWVEKSKKYHTSLPADIALKDCKLEGDMYHFSIDINGHIIENLQLGLGGFHNVENALAAAAICYYHGVKDDSIRIAFANFRGVKRRFEYIVRNEKCIYIDDYAHHPEELSACINSVKALYPDKKITGVFQPHLYSRTRDFYEEFATSLSLLDEIILLEIYPARELPIEGVSSLALLEKIKSNNKLLCSKEQLVTVILEKQPEVLLTLGAGDIDQFVNKIKDSLTANIQLT